jgi:hypothetical protein
MSDPRPGARMSLKTKKIGTQQWGRLLHAEFELRRGDLARIRAEEIRFLEAAQERRARPQTDGLAPDISASLGQYKLNPGFGFAVANTTELADGPPGPQKSRYYYVKFRGLAIARRGALHAISSLLS